MHSSDDPERFARVRELFDAALELSPAERAAFVRTRAGADAELSAAVERLLATLRDDDDFMTPPSAGRLGAAYSPAPTFRAGDVVGRYTIERALGSGGMGAVYAATQSRPSRTVALKVLSAPPGAELARRFELEAEILARLRHPGIAAIHELGVHRTPEGYEAPFLAMELIEGARDLIRFARETQLALPARLELFRQVCAATHHAHQRGVIHRDLKPGNVLVDAAGHPKIIDYGIARLDDPLGAATSRTQTGAVLGTLQYASPEQLSGAQDGVDVRTDVYSLGLMLYELVSDRRPYEVAGRPITEVIAEVCEREPQAPSRVAPSTPRELDWIVMKAIAKDRERRYDSAAALALDLERFARREPLLAGPPTTRYVVGKFLARHRVAVGLTAGIVAAVLVGFAATALALVEAREQSERADRALSAERDQTRKTETALRRQASVLDAVRSTLGALEPGQSGRNVTLAELLERRTSSLGADSAIEPEVRASLQTFLAEAYLNLGLFEPSTSAAEGGLEAIAASAEPDVELRARLRLMLTRLRILALRFQDAEVELELAFADLNALGLLDGQRGVDAYRLRAELLEKLGRTTEAATAYVEAVARAERVLGPDDQVTLRILSESAMLLAALRRFEEAEVNAQLAYERSRKVFGPDHPLTLPTAMRYGLILQQLGKFAALVPLQQSVVDGALKAFGEQHRNVPYAMSSLASAQLANADAAGAEATARRAFELVAKHHPSDHEIEGMVRGGLANALLALERDGEALEVLELGVRRLERGPLASHPMLAELRGSLARLYLKLERFDDAEAQYRAGLETARASFPEGHPNRAFFSGQIARIRVMAHSDEQAVPALREACDALATSPRPDHAAARRAMAAQLQAWYAAHGQTAESALYAAIAQPAPAR
jgi:tetratricopeptide (TPR) repeat protein